MPNLARLAAILIGLGGCGEIGPEAEVDAKESDSVLARVEVAISNLKGAMPPCRLIEKVAHVDSTGGGVVPGQGKREKLGFGLGFLSEGRLMSRQLKKD